MRLLTIFCLLFSFGLMAKDYKSLQRLNEGDVISAEVFNDILDKIELSLKSIDTSELVGSWDVLWKTCINGGPGNCSGLNVGDGWTSGTDSLFKNRVDTWTIADDGDGTYSLSIEKYCVTGASAGVYFNDPCTGRISVDSGIFLFGKSDDVDHTEMYNIKRISDTRFLLWQLKSGSGSFVSFRLDKKNLPPEPPANLTAINSSGTISLSWDAVVATETFLVDGTTPVKQSEGAASSYKIQSKDAADVTYTDLATATTNSYTDSITSGTTRWYRVFAVNEYGTSKGSNVVSISYSE